MAIFHCSVKAISRSTGRSSTAAAAYRAGECIFDERTGEIHDYTRKGGVDYAQIIMPSNIKWIANRSTLWNTAEKAERRKDACVAREIVVALPCELTAEQRKLLALDFAKQMANDEQCAVDVCIHQPNKQGDDRNHHAHILRTTRKVEENGLGAKLETEKAGRNRRADLERLRGNWERLTNRALEKAGKRERVSRLSLKEQGIIDRLPQQHLGVGAIGYERRTGQKSRKRIEIEQANSRLAKIAKEVQEALARTERSIIDLSTSLFAAIRERNVTQKVDAILTSRREQSSRLSLEERLKQRQERQAAEQRAAAERERLRAEQEEAQERKEFEAEEEQQSRDWGGLEL